MTAEPGEATGDRTDVAVTIEVPARSARGDYRFTVVVGDASAPVDVVFNKGRP